MYVCPCVHLCASVCIYVSPCVCLPVCASVHVYVCLCVRLSVRTSVRAYICVCVCLQTRLCKCRLCVEVLYVYIRFGGRCTSLCYRQSNKGSKGLIAQEFAFLISILWSGKYQCVVPRDFKVCTSTSPRFQRLQALIILFILPVTRARLNNLMQQSVRSLNTRGFPEDVGVSCCYIAILLSVDCYLCNPSPYFPILNKTLN